MTVIAGDRLSLPTKLLALATATQIVVFALQVAIVGAMDGTGRAIALAAPLTIPLFIVFFVTRWIVRRMTAPLIVAYERMAAGDFQPTLPALTGGSDFRGVRSALQAMGAALARSTAALRDADLDRRRLFADLAHELATPTTTLLGIAHALREGTGDRAHLLEHLEHETARLERLIADVREVAHLEDPALVIAAVPCDLGAIARRAIERIHLAAPATCRLRCEAEALVATVDPLRIEQVLANLLANAIRYAPEGTVRVAVLADGDDAVVRVEDSGPGVPEDQLPLLGRRLLRVDSSRSRDSGGHGLGLSIVRGIVARHRGGLTFARAELGGLAVEVRLPRAGPAT